MSDDEEHYEMSCSLGSLHLSVEGTDDEWVRETFREEWQERMDEAAKMEDAVRTGTRGHQ